MSFKTTVLNAVRRIAFLAPVENFLVKKIAQGSILATKMIPGNKMYPYGTLRTCNRDGINFTLDISDYMDHALYFRVTQGADFDRRVLYNLIQEHFICYDIGANIGETTLNFAKRATHGKVYSFEPVPYLFKRLIKNIQSNNFNNIQLLNIALADQPETLYFEMPLNHNSSGISLFKTPTQKAIAVDCTTLDLLADDDQLTPPHFLKIDVEGFEYAVIKGAFRMLQKFKPLLYIEVNQYNLNKAGSSEMQLLSILQNDLNYTLYKIDGIQKIKITDIKNTGMHYDILCEPIK
jgi:FkbM family methyltransferase